MIDHVTKLFLEWHEDTISEQHRTKVNSHLEQCSTCRMYFEKMSAVIDDPSLLKLKEIQANPNLPARIRALKAGYEQRHRHYPILRWSFAGAGAVLGIIIGIYLGKGLPGIEQTSQSGTDLSEYHNVIAQHGLI